ncbi:MAG: hypothetical protein IPN86_04165 [Saprospiraceae bacterium]|nr:hypothetical protein [Saprospiraceae bacterium]
MSININKSSITNLAIFGSVASFFILINSDGLGAVDNSNPSNIMYWLVIASSAYLFLRIIIHLGSLKYESLTVNKYKYLNPLYYSLLLVLLIFGSANFAKYGYKKEPRFEPAFEKADSNVTKILILPLFPKVNNSILEVNYESLLSNELNNNFKSFGVQSKIFDEKINILYGESLKNRHLIFDDAIKIGEINNADIIIYGTYDESGSFNQFDVCLKIFEVNVFDDFFGKKLKMYNLNKEGCCNYADIGKFNSIDSILNIPSFKYLSCSILEYTFYNFISSKYNIGAVEDSDLIYLENLLIKDKHCSDIEIASRKILLDLFLKNNFNSSKYKDIIDHFKIEPNTNFSKLILENVFILHEMNLFDTLKYDFIKQLAYEKYFSKKVLLNTQIFKLHPYKSNQYLEELINDNNDRYYFLSMVSLINELIVHKKNKSCKRVSVLRIFF